MKLMMLRPSGLSRLDYEAVRDLDSGLRLPLKEEEPLDRLDHHRAPLRWLRHLEESVRHSAVGR